MATKQELGNEISRLMRERHKLQVAVGEQKVELVRLRREDQRRQENARLTAQREAAARKRQKRREHLDHLGAGRLPLKGAESWAFVHEPGKSVAIEVTVPLDADELRVLQEALKPKQKHESVPIGFLFPEVDHLSPVISPRSRSIWEDYFSAGRRI